MSSESLPIQIETTSDGSPTFRFEHETMHNREGAFSESLYIYLEAMSEAYKMGLPCNTLSLGLGLGYNEMLWAALALRHETPLGTWQLSSFESEDELRQFFLNWLVHKDVPYELLSAYNEIAERVGRQFELSPSEIKNELIRRKEVFDWRIQPTLSRETLFEEKFQCVLFDAYSGSTSPELWEPLFLEEFIQRACAPHCVFSTYAAKGTLTRALEKQQFKVQLRTGFGGKRHSTWALRQS